MPNVSSLRSQIISKQILTAQKFSASGNNYGIVTTANAHMMKNSEWGAVAYLSQSKYGKYGNSSYTGVNKEVYINNYWNNVTSTGCSAGAPNTANSNSCAYRYHVSPEGTGASTTGTIYGVYDMSGGAWEHVMGNYRKLTLDAGLSSMPASQYYDEYEQTLLKACNGKICYGHALSETVGWYSDMENFVSLSRSWVIRGGSYSNTKYVGLFSFSTSTGGSVDNHSFRVVLLY